QTLDQPQPSDQAGWLLPLERLPGSPEPETEILQLPRGATRTTVAIGDPGDRGRDSPGAANLLRVWPAGWRLLLLAPRSRRRPVRRLPDRALSGRGISSPRRPPDDRVSKSAP